MTKMIHQSLHIFSMIKDCVLAFVRRKSKTGSLWRDQSVVSLPTPQVLLAVTSNVNQECRGKRQLLSRF
jgi:hypothetical protein